MTEAEGRAARARAVETEPAERAQEPAQEPPAVLSSEPLSQGQLIWRRFKRHRLGMLGGVVIILLAMLALFAEFLGPYNAATEQRRFSYAPPTPIRFFHEGRFIGPFVYGLVRERDPLTFETVYREDRSLIYPIKFFVRGDRYKLLWLFETDIHLFGTGEPPGSPGQIFLFGTDLWGRDLFTRTLVGGRISLAIGPAVVVIIMLVGAFFGGISGYFGGWVDMLIQRIIEVLQSFPTLPLYLALGAILPANLPNWARVVGIIIIFSVLGWTGLARVLRGQFLALREEEFALAARAMGASHLRIIFRHLLPNAMSYLIVSATLAIPSLIIAEATLSFLGLGIKEPLTSWGELLNDAQEWSALSSHPWLLIPGIFIVVAVLAFNFMGDALRDAVDPYTSTRGAAGGG
jgi:peptide/nickel transport system permease protein